MAEEIKKYCTTNNSGSGESNSEDLKTDPKYISSEMAIKRINDLIASIDPTQVLAIGKLRGAIIKLQEG